jgi:hypothetical protein
VQELTGEGRRAVERSSRVKTEREGRDEDDEDLSVIFQKSKGCTVK